MAAPFLTVYLIRQLGYPLSTATSLWSRARSPTR